MPELAREKFLVALSCRLVLLGFTATAPTITAAQVRAQARRKERDAELAQLLAELDKRLGVER